MSFQFPLREQQYNACMFRNFRRIWPAAVLVVGIYFIPSIHERLARRVDDLRTQVKYFFQPTGPGCFHPDPAGRFCQNLLETSFTVY